jgi:hypothetical protein
VNEIASVPDADLGDTDDDAAERCRRLFVRWAHEVRIERVRWITKASGPTETDAETFAMDEASNLGRIMPLIREKHRDEPEWNPGTSDEFASRMLLRQVTDSSMGYRTRGLLGANWRSYSQLSQAAQGKFEGEIWRMIALSQARVAVRAAAFDAKVQR